MRRLYERRQFRARRSQVFVTVHVHAEPATTAQHQTAAAVAVRTAEQVATGQPAQLLRGHRHNKSTCSSGAAVHKNTHQQSTNRFCRKKGVVVN